MAPRYSIDVNGRKYAMKVQRPGLNRALAMDVVILNLGPVRKVAIWEYVWFGFIKFNQSSRYLCDWSDWVSNI